MATFCITIRHHSISRAPVVRFEGTLHGAKLAATREFGDGFRDHEMVIRKDDGSYEEQWPVVATKVIGNAKWADWY